MTWKTDDSEQTPADTVSGMMVPYSVATTSHDQWIDAIQDAVGQMVQSIINTGRIIQDCKDSTPHGRFGEIVRAAGLSPRTAERFMAIARNPVLTDAAQLSHLPPSWSTLYELSTLPDKSLRRMIEDGQVTPETTRTQLGLIMAHILEEF